MCGKSGKGLRPLSIKLEHVFPISPSLVLIVLGQVDVEARACG